VTAIDRVLALDPQVSAYDAAYITLCEELGATLVTCDDRLTRTTGERVDLNVIGVSEPRA
jgi:predicted nucleic acid-binding protein